MVSIVVVIVVAAAGVALAVAVVVAFTASARGGPGADAPLPPPPPSAARERRTVALRLEGESDLSFARQLIERHGGRCEGQVGDVAVDLMRLAPTATHFYLGPVIASVRTNLPGGMVIKFDVEPMAGDGDGLAGVIAALRGLSSPRFAHLAVVAPAPSGTALEAVDDDERPGHRRCLHCRHAFVVSEFECPNCGGRVEAP